MYIIIAGCRKVGYNLAIQLSQENHDVVVIDSDPKNLEPLGSGFNGVAITGMPIDEDVLRSAGIDRADALAAVTNDDNMNVMISEIARELFKVPNVITRVYDPVRETVFLQMGLDTICPTTLAVARIKEGLLTCGHRESINIQGSMVEFRHVKPGKKHIGKSVSEIRGENIFGLIRHGKFLFPTEHMHVEALDTLIIADYTDGMVD